MVMVVIVMMVVMIMVMMMVEIISLMMFKVTPNLRSSGTLTELGSSLEMGTTTRCSRIQKQT